MSLTKVTYSMIESAPANVLDYGAVADGVTDSTAAFTAALAASKIVYVPLGKYVIGDLVVPSGSVITGDSARLEAANNTLYGDVWLLKKASAVCVLNVSGSTGVRITGINIDGLDATAFGISAGSILLTLENVCVTRCSNGLGGAIGAGSAYTSVASIYFCTFRNCTNGATNLIDTIVNGGAFTANNYGVALGAGASANTFVGVRFEFNTYYGLDCFSNGILNVIGGLFDRNFKSGIKISTNANPITITGVEFRRNGKDNSSPNDSHIYLSNATDIVISAITTTTGVDDDGSGALTPAYVLRYAGTNTNISVDGDLNGFVSGFSAGFIPTEFTKSAAGFLQILTANVPASATATGLKGEISWDANYIYVCTATDTWKRVAIATW